ncbi:MAG: ATP-binding protein, partial [Gemmatimonadota bacterium]|nr:ATP-binding protein [Gemmatimonadota bacterium]
MIALGLLARDPKLRHQVLGERDPAPKLGRCRVVGFNGRSTDAPGGIWGSIAEQLGKADQFSRYVSPMLSAPGPQAWRQLLGGDPLVLFLDELPPYLEYAVAVPVGNGDLGVVTTTALANLFVAVAEMDNVCLVLSDLAGTSFSIGQSNLQAAFDRARNGITNEARRIAVPITPVNPNGDELYHILRKRLFEKLAPDAEIQRIAAAYREALREASKMGLTSTAPETLYTRVLDAYPFHPDLRELIGKFKENEGFQQTRGVIRLMQMVIADLWNSKRAAAMDLIHPYDLDVNLDEIASEVRTINPALSEAIAHDIAHHGDAEVEQIDAANGNSDASDAARLILIASLSTTPGAIHGLREYQLVDCLQRPGRDLSTFKANVLDKLATRAWYLHNSADGRLYFKNQQNLAAKLRSTALSLHPQTVERMLREQLEAQFAASLRDCYQVVKVLPPLDQVQLEQEKCTLVIVRPGGQANQLPISPEWQAWWEQQAYKNRVLFLSGSRDTYQKVIDAARQSRALQSIDDELRSESTPTDDPQWRALDALRDRVGL